MGPEESAEGLYAVAVACEFLDGSKTYNKISGYFDSKRRAEAQAEENGHELGHYLGTAEEALMPTGELCDDVGYFVEDAGHFLDGLIRVLGPIRAGHEALS